jgi:outer membrane protein assembly factor BamD (BamD/ComL family)
MKTVSDLYQEIEEVRNRNLVHAVHYYNQLDDPFHYPRTFSTPMINVVSLEFKESIPHESVQKVYEYIKRCYALVLFDVKLVAQNRINIYTMNRVS